MNLDNILIEGSKEAKNLLIFAHGAGAPMDSIFMNTIVENIIKSDILIIRFEFPYMSKRRLGIRTFPDNISFLSEYYKDMYYQIKIMFPNKNIWLGGKSMGGRISAIISKEISVKGVIVFGYPFHPLNNVNKLRLKCLQSKGPPILIMQGTRDKFGNINEVNTYYISDKNLIFWIEDGDHSFNTLKKSKNNSSVSIKNACLRASSFILKNQTD